jgi:hypothetical protein
MIDTSILTTLPLPIGYYVAVGGISFLLIGVNLFLTIKQSKATDGIKELNQTIKEIKAILESKSK